ncbi:hypothetical protein Z947_1631 [Sulfitobacter geojensis]|nr:hypothetical protein Z947_1631 [Sulfitobacter geojensis]NYI30246.1 hypothetical protein [Sulfitobacter geojensis]
MRVAGVSQHLLGLAHFNNFSLIHDRDAVADAFYDGDIMRDEQKGNAKLILDVLHQLRDPRCRRDIRCRHRLIRDDHLGPLNKTVRAMCSHG